MRGQEIINVTDGIFSAEGQEPEQLDPASPWGSACTYATPQARMIHSWPRFLHHWIQCSHEKCWVKTAQESLTRISERMQARDVCCFARGPRYNGRDCNRPDVQRFELSSRKGAGGLPDTGRAQQQHQRVGRKAQCRFTESYPPLSSMGPCRAQLCLASSSGCPLPTPATTREPQTQPLPLATQLSQILKRTLLKLQYILFLASKYPSVSTYSWLFSAILQPPALNLSVLDFLLDPYRRKKTFQAPQALLYKSNHYNGGRVLEVVLSWCPCHHTLPGEQRWQNVPRCFGADRTAHMQLLSTEQKENPSEPITQLGCSVMPKAENHTCSTDLEQPQAKYSPLFGLLKPPRRCCHQSSTTCRSPCSWHRQCLQGEKVQLSILGRPAGNAHLGHWNSNHACGGGQEPALALPAPSLVNQH